MVRGPLGHISAISITPSVLDRDCFVFVPWEEDISAKSPFDYLVDVFSDIPYIYNRRTWPDGACEAGGLVLRAQLAHSAALLTMQG